jgi:site-specific DNA-methyltransferase (adenine-specific)/adenine-specific DNA-methyltransferase
VPELIWKGKYDESGARQEPLRLVAEIETVEEIPAGAPLDTPHGRLILGEAHGVLPALLAEIGPSVDLVYIDPPFCVGRDFASRPAPRSANPESPATAYSDRWEGGLDEYLQWLSEIFILLRELLAPDGSLYVHLDWRASHYARAILDELFGPDCFQNEIVWLYREAINSRKRWNRKHDTILLYTRDPMRFQFNADAVLQPHAATTIAKYRREDEQGPYRLMGRGIVGSPIQSARDVAPEWERTHPDLVYRQYLRKGTYPVDYLKIDIVNQASRERLGYPTQKPEALIEKLVLASSDPDDLVLDCFCGSGTTPAVAAQLGRRWIGADSSRLAVETSRARLAALGAGPFAVQRAAGSMPEA